MSDDLDLTVLSPTETFQLSNWLSNEGSFMANELIYRWAQDGDPALPYRAELALPVSGLTVRLSLEVEVQP